MMQHRVSRGSVGTGLFLSGSHFGGDLLLIWPLAGLLVLTMSPVSLWGTHSVAGPPSLLPPPRVGPSSSSSLPLSLLFPLCSPISPSLALFLSLLPSYPFSPSFTPLSSCLFTQQTQLGICSFISNREVCQLDVTSRLVPVAVPWKTS